MILKNLRNVRGFFSDYYLGSVFLKGSGPTRRRSSHRGSDLAYARFCRIWERAEGRAQDPASVRERFARPLFRDVLGFHLGAEEEGVYGLFPSADAETNGDRPLLLAYCGAWDEDLNASKGSGNPMRHIEALLSQKGLGHGILLTGERLRLVRAQDEGPRGAYLEVDLVGLAEEEDRESFAAFHRLLAVSSFLPDANGKIPIDEVERESRQHAEKVSDDLKGAVFAAAESLVSGLIQDAASQGLIPTGLDLNESDLRAFRDAAFLALYRILFILYAEARDPRLEEHRLYRDSYSAQGLLDEILKDPCRSWPENRSSFWCRLRALFRIYDQGLPAITPWDNIPPRGGDFFSHQTPAGTILDRARLHDRAVSELMVRLSTTSPRRGLGRERVSFRELDIENLGAVYEGLLEHEPRIAHGIVLEVRVQGRTYALPPSELARLCEQRNLVLRGDFSLVEKTEAEALHPEAPQEGEEEEIEDPEHVRLEESDLDSVDEEEDEGVKKGGTATIVRRLEPGSFHFVPGPGRKGSGSFYTPRPLVKDLVHHALAPLIQERTAAEIERLRVLDPACGSAHFLVEAMRFLGQALHKEYVKEHGGKAPPGFRNTVGEWDNNWRASDEDARLANSEARAWCKRRIAERCLFGVDLNPTAVELARVALWIESVAGDRPLTYFHHHIRSGNSLLGTWMGRLEAPPLPSLARRRAEAQQGLFQKLVRDSLEEAAKTRRMIDEATPEDLLREGIDPESTKEQEFKEHQRTKAEKTLEAVKLLFDLRMASAYVPEIWMEWPALCSLVDSLPRLKEHCISSSWWNDFRAVQERERFFHWEVEFPEVFLNGGKPGFDAVLGNPPWDKVLPARKDFYARSDVLIRAFTGNDLDRRIRELHDRTPGLAEEFSEYRERTRTFAQYLRKSGDFPLSEARTGAAHEDVSKYFLDRAARLVREGGRVGMVAPSVFYNGDGCVGIRRFLIQHADVERFYGFENREKIFPIHSSYKFVSLVFRKGEPQTDGFRAAFMRHDLQELGATARVREVGKEKVKPGPAPWIIKIKSEEIRRLSPETLAFLEYRGPRDQTIVAKMHESRPTIGSGKPNSWRAKLFTDLAHSQIYNSNRDKDLWTCPKSGRLYASDWVLSSVPRDFGEVLECMREKGFWPVFEGKHIDQFLVGIKPIRWWLSLEQVEKKYGKPPSSKPMLVFRDIARNTDERCLIAAVLPAMSTASDTLNGLLSDQVEPDHAAAVLNSFPFDWGLRLRIAGTHVSQTYLRPMPVPPADLVNRMPQVKTRLAWEAGIDHITGDRNLWPELWAVNRAVAEAYDLGPEDFRHILSSFPGFARKRRDFHAYLTSRLADWAEEKGLAPYDTAEGERELRIAAESSRPYGSNHNQD